MALTPEAQEAIQKECERYHIRNYKSESKVHGAIVALKILGYFVGFLIIVLSAFLAAGGYKTILAIPDNYVMNRVTARAEQFEHLYLANLMSIADQQDAAFNETNRFLDAFDERRTENSVFRFMVAHELESTQRSYFFISMLRILANIDSSMGDPLRVYWRKLNEDPYFMTEFKADERWRKDYMFNVSMAAACAKFENPSSPRKWETVQSYWERALDAADTASRKLAIKRTLMLMHPDGEYGAVTWRGIEIRDRDRFQLAS